jgi:hypothetical protein
MRYNVVMKNPYINAVLAEAYIVLLITLGHFFATPNTPDKFFTPMLALSIFVVSAAIMGYLFLAEPFRLYLDGQKAQATKSFGKTLGTFAVMTILLGLLQILVK